MATSKDMILTLVYLFVISVETATGTAVCDDYTAPLPITPVNPLGGATMTTEQLFEITPNVNQQNVAEITVAGDANPLIVVPSDDFSTSPILNAADRKAVIEDIGAVVQLPGTLVQKLTTLQDTSLLDIFLHKSTDGNNKVVTLFNPKANTNYQDLITASGFVLYDVVAYTAISQIQTGAVPVYVVAANGATVTAKKCGGIADGQSCVGAEQNCQEGLTCGSGTNNCECADPVTNYYDTGLKACHLKKNYGESCSSSSLNSCTSDFQCTSSVCKCADTDYYANSICNIRKTINETCDVSIADQCAANLQCLDALCAHLDSDSGTATINTMNTLWMISAVTAVILSRNWQ